MNLWNWVLIIAGAVMILMEVSLGGFAGFDLVLIGSAFVIGGAAGLLFGSTTIGLAVASVLCIVYIAVGRRWVRARMHVGHVPSNIDALMGKQGKVLQRIAPQTPGMIKVNDETWRAEVAPGAQGPFEPDALVTVAGVNGVTLQVR
jgi:membrane protein implicated in regulation of membrane protease activity